MRIGIDCEATSDINIIKLVAWAYTDKYVLNVSQFESRGTDKDGYEYGYAGTQKKGLTEVTIDSLRSDTLLVFSLIDRKTHKVYATRSYIVRFNAIPVTRNFSYFDPDTNRIEYVTLKPTEQGKNPKSLSFSGQEFFSELSYQ